MTSALTPAISGSALYPPDAVYMARTTLFQTRMLGYTALNLDLVTAYLQGLINGRAAVRHEAGCSSEIRSLFRRAGVVLEEETFPFRTAEEAFGHAERLAGQGRRLFYPYPLPDGLFAEDSQLVSPRTYRFLNAKSNLEAIVPGKNLARRQQFTLAALDGYRWSEPVFLKGACGAATGWGFAVHPCRDRAAFEKAREWFAAHLERDHTVIVEAWEEVAICWCVGIVVTDEGTTCLGGAEQLFSAPARQRGSMIDPENLLPGEGRALAVRIGEAARQSGYRGIAGLDIGRCRDGRLVVFDPNFRINSSSAQLLFHDSAASRSGLAASCSFHGQAKGSFHTQAERLNGPIDEGWFIPTCLFDGEKHPESLGSHTIIGFVMGEHRQDAVENTARLQKILEG